MKSIYFAFSLALFASCASESSNPGAASEGDTSEIAQAGDTCNCSELTIDSTGLHARDNKAFTGICINYYQGTEDKYIEKQILKGKLHGKVYYYDKNGEIMLEETYEQGQHRISGTTGSGTTCDCTVLETVAMQGQTVYTLNGAPFTGRCEKYYEGTTTLYMESNYKEGLLDGHTVYYSKDGSTILMENYESGELVSSMH